MSTNSPPRPRGHRYWIPAFVALLVIAGLVVVELQAELDNNIKGWIRTGIAALGLVLIAVWFLLLSRYTWRVRLCGVLAVGLGILAGRQLLRVDGTVDGTGRPRLVWKWAGRSAASSAPLPAGPMASEGVATNSLTTEQEPAIARPAGVLDTPQFLGPRRDGVLTGAGIARDWAVSPPKELWRQPIGVGWSAFSVVGGRAFTQEQRDEEEWVTCYELRTGRLLWAQTNHARFFEWQGGGGPRSTPTVDRGRVFAYGGTGILNCLEADTGRRVWTRDVLAEHQLPNLIWGTSASPLVFEETVVVTGALEDRATVIAYDRETGAPRWKAGSEKAAYSSPVLATLAGKQVVLSVNAVNLTAHDPATGAVLLVFKWGSDKPPKAAQPVVLEGDRVFLSAGYAMGCVMIRVKASPDGKLTADELWRNKMMKTQFNSPAARGGYIYGLDDGLLACVDASDGTRRWKDGRYGAGQSLLVDDLVLIQSERGPVVLAEASPGGFRELARVAALSTKTWNYPTLAGRYLLARNDQEAVCYEIPAATISSP